MAKIIQFSTESHGDDITIQKVVVTTVLYDDGTIYEGCLETVAGDYNNGFKKEMVWYPVTLPNHKGLV